MPQTLKMHYNPGPMSQDEDIIRLAVDAMLRLVAERGWRNLALGDVAHAADVPLHDLRARFACKTAVLLAYARRVEAEARAQPAPFDDSDTTRDRLFELLMQRLDLLSPERAAVAAIVRDLPRTPLAVLSMAPEVMRLLAGVLEAAGVSARGPDGLLRCKGLAAIWVGTLAVWAGDDSPDSARTMAALDRFLRQSGPAAKFLAACPFSGGWRAPEGEHDGRAIVE